MTYCKPTTKSNSVNQKLSTLPRLNEDVSCAAVVSSYCLLCFPTSSCFLMSDTSMGTLTVRPSIHFLTHTWQPRRDLRRKHEVRLLCSQTKGRIFPPTLGCLFTTAPVRDLLCLKRKQLSLRHSYNTEQAPSPWKEVPCGENLP